MSPRTRQGFRREAFALRGAVTSRVMARALALGVLACGICGLAWLVGGMFHFADRPPATRPRPSPPPGCPPVPIRPRLVALMLEHGASLASKRGSSMPRLPAGAGRARTPLQDHPDPGADAVSLWLPRARAPSLWGLEGEKILLYPRRHKPADAVQFPCSRIRGTRVSPGTCGSPNRTASAGLCLGRSWR
jgi:hypothetical protein